MFIKPSIIKKISSSKLKYTRSRTNSYDIYNKLTNCIDNKKNAKNVYLDSYDYFNNILVCYWFDIKRGLYKNTVTGVFTISKSQYTYARDFKNRFLKRVFLASPEFINE